MERHAGVESLVGWIKRECLDEIKGAASWAELHQVMRDNGLALRARGISGVNRQRIAAGIRQRLRRAPLSFVLPPRATDDERVDDLPAGEPDDQQAKDEAPRHG